MNKRVLFAALAFCLAALFSACTGAKAPKPAAYTGGGSEPAPYAAASPAQPDAQKESPVFDIAAKWDALYKSSQSVPSDDSMILLEDGTLLVSYANVTYKKDGEKLKKLVNGTLIAAADGVILAVREATLYAYNYDGDSFDWSLAPQIAQTDAKALHDVQLTQGGRFVFTCDGQSATFAWTQLYSCDMTGEDLIHYNALDAAAKAVAEDSEAMPLESLKNPVVAGDTIYCKVISQDMVARAAQILTTGEYALTGAPPEYTLERAKDMGDYNSVFTIKLSMDNSSREYIDYQSIEGERHTLFDVCMNAYMELFGADEAGNIYLRESNYDDGKKRLLCVSLADNTYKESDYYKGSNLRLNFGSIPCDLPDICGDTIYFIEPWDTKESIAHSIFSCDMDFENQTLVIPLGDDHGDKYATALFACDGYIFYSTVEKVTDGVRRGRYLYDMETKQTIDVTDML